MKYEIDEKVIDYLRGFQLVQPLHKRHYLTFAIAKIRKNEHEQLTPMEMDSVFEFILYCLKH